MTHTYNHLIHEKSPYLQQHAYNPVDWYAWGDEAFEHWYFQIFSFIVNYSKGITHFSADTKILFAIFSNAFIN